MQTKACITESGVRVIVIMQIVRRCGSDECGCPAALLLPPPSLARLSRFCPMIGQRIMHHAQSKRIRSHTTMPTTTKHRQKP